MQPPLVLLPGMMCDARLFQPQIAAFSAERPVMVMPLSSADTIEVLAKDILDNAPPVFALAGWVLGKAVCSESHRGRQYYPESFVANEWRGRCENRLSARRYRAWHA